MPSIICRLNGSQTIGELVDTLTYCQCLLLDWREQKNSWKQYEVSKLPSLFHGIVANTVQKKCSVTYYRTDEPILIFGQYGLAGRLR